MQGPRTNTTGDVPARRFLSPLQAFLVVLALVGLGLGIWWIQARGGEPEDGPQVGSPSATPTVLTEAEAIEIFERLDGQRLDAYRFTDPTLVDVTFTEEGDLGRRVRKEIAGLIRDGVKAVPKIRTRSLKLVSAGPVEIQLRQVAVIDARFIDSRGQDITRGGGPEEQVILWTLQERSEGWLLHDAVVERATPVKGATS